MKYTAVQLSAPTWPLTLPADRRVCVGYRLRWLRRASGRRCESLLQVGEVRNYTDNSGDLQDSQDISTEGYQP